MLSELPGQLLKLLNLPDLIIIAIVLINMLSGFRRGRHPLKQKKNNL